MRSSTFFTMKITAIFISAILLLLTACSITPESISKIDSPSEEQAITHDNTDEFISATIESGKSLGAKGPDGSSLLESHCTRCHITQWLEKIEKSPTEWEATLERMETLGVSLNDSEKIDLLNYLSIKVNP